MFRVWYFSCLQSKSKELLCTYLVYIKEKMAERGSGVSETEMVRLLKDCVVLVTKHGSKQPSREVIHFSSAYKHEDDLVTKFPGTLHYRFLMQTIILVT